MADAEGDSGGRVNVEDGLLEKGVHFLEDRNYLVTKKIAYLTESLNRTFPINLQFT